MNDANALCSFLSNMTRAERTLAIDKIVLHCFVPRHTVFNWQRGLSRIPTLHKREIEKIFDKKIFEST